MALSSSLEFPPRIWWIPTTHLRAQAAPMWLVAITGVLSDFLSLVGELFALELIKEKHPESKTRLRKFWMDIYCFPDPTNSVQRVLIRQIGSQENEMQATFIKMSDADKLITCRRNMKDLHASDLKGSLMSLINFF